MGKGFNLIDEPWISVRMLDGSANNVGLGQLFEKSHEIRSLEEDSPTTLIALYRLLLTITHRAMMSAYVKKWSHSDRVHWYNEGFPVDVFERYWAAWRERFWLFHPEYPFMQVAELAISKETRSKVKPWTQISFGNACGASPTVFDHSRDSVPVAIDPAAAIKMLLGYLQFCPGGLVKVLRASDKAGPLANTAAILPVGNNLAETLCLALHPPSSSLSEDLPVWERSTVQISDLKAESTSVSGPNDQYTRISRATLFVREHDDLVRWLHFAPGLALSDNVPPDPMAVYGQGKSGPIRFNFSSGRDIWRDLSLLIAAGSQNSFASAAEVLTWASELHALLGGKGDQKLLVGGLASNQAKLLRWRMMVITLPVSIFSDVEATQLLMGEIKRAEDMHGQLRILATKMLSSIMPGADRPETFAQAQAVLDQGPLTGEFFTPLQRVLPRVMMLISSGAASEARRHWTDALALAAGRVWILLEKSLGSSWSALRAEALYRSRFNALVDSLTINDLDSTV